MEIYSVVEQILKILNLAMPTIFYEYKLWKEIRKSKAKENEPSVTVKCDSFGRNGY